ncbi:MAG: rotamase, partial [Phenylobacterium sp.]|nr:rotamase [Phenylobacterium sp.]
YTAEAPTFGLVVAKLEAVRAPTGPTLARMTEESRPQMTESTFREIQADAQKAAGTLVKVKTYPNNARLAIGLEPIEPKKDAPAPKTEKAK